MPWRRCIGRCSNVNPCESQLSGGPTAFNRHIQQSTGLNGASRLPTENRQPQEVLFFCLRVIGCRSRSLLSAQGAERALSIDYIKFPQIPAMVRCRLKSDFTWVTSAAAGPPLIALLGSLSKAMLSMLVPAFFSFLVAASRVSWFAS